MSCDISSIQLWSWLDRGAPELDEHLAHCARCRRLARLLRSETEALSRTAGWGSAIPEGIGAYKIVSVLGRGGMGIVYRAIQPATERHVALKVMSSDIEGSRRFVRCFERETKALGRLNHPHIARVYDSGCTEDGQRFIVMELVEGEAIDRYVHTRRPSRQELLRQFVNICDAIAHAHAHGVLHRDIKPSNILVTAAAEVRVLDFGLARLTEPQDRFGSTLTHTTQLVGTLPYISPEQIDNRGHKVTEQSDVYSLGVLLYQLLTGRLPFSHCKSHKETMDAVCMGLHPSPKSLDPSIPRDLNTIIETALEREPSCRYSSAAELRDDLERYLADRPIQARSPTLWYRMGKTVRRHRLAFALVASLFAILFGSSVVTTTLFIRARRAEHLANSRLSLLGAARDEARAESQRFESEARKATAISASLAHILEMVHPITLKPGRLMDSSLVAQISAILEQEMEDLPLLAADLHSALGASLLYRSDFQAARRQFEQAIELRQQHLPEGSPAIARSHYELGSLLCNNGEFGPAIRHFEQAMACYMSQEPRDEAALALAQAGYGATLIATGHFEDGGAVAIRALEQSRDRSPHSSDLALALEQVASAYGRIGRYQEASALMTKSVSIFRERGDLPDLVRGLMSLTDAALVLGHVDEARAHATEALECSLTLVGRTYPFVAIQLSQLSDLAVDRNDIESAKELAERAADMARDLSPEHRTGYFASKLGGLAWLRGDYAAAEKVYRELLEQTEQRFGRASAEYARCASTLGVILRDKGDYTEAETLLRQAYAARQEMDEIDQGENARVANNLARLLLLMGELAEAESLIGRALEVRTQLMGQESTDVAESQMVLGTILLRQGRIPEAHHYLERALTVRQDNYPDNHLWVAEARSAMGEWLSAAGRCDEARAMLEGALRDMRREVQESHRCVMITRERLAAVNRCLANGDGSVSESALTPEG